MTLHSASTWVLALSLAIGMPAAAAAQQSPVLGGGAGLANPASVNCIDTLGGTLQIVDNAKGQAGYCHLKDGRACEEWALFRDGSCVAPQ